MNVFYREMRGNLKSLIIWSISAGLMVFLGMMKFSAISAGGNASIELFNSLPDAVKAIFGLSGVDITQVGGFFSMLFLYILLLAAVHSGMLGATIISKEERDKTADYIFAKPRTRTSIIMWKIGAWFVNIVIFNIVICLSSFSAVSMYETGKSLNSEIVILMIALFILQLLFGMIGFVASSLAKTSKKATSIVAFVILGTYILSVAINMNDDLKSLAVLTPFRYFDSIAIMTGKPLDMTNAIFVGLASAIFAIATLYFYKKRDIKI